VVAAVLAALCIGGIVAAFSGGDDSDTSNPAAQAPSARLGEPVRDGEFEFTVTKTKCGQTTVGDEPFVERAQGEFCLVNLTVKNVGTKAQTLDGSSQKAIGADGHTYESSPTALVAANNDNSTVFNNINPGNEVHGTLVYDVPANTDLTTIELHDSPFSGGVQAPLQ
jgi:hypothetical protein